MTLSDDELTVEVNSRERFEGLKTWLEKIPGVRLRSLTVDDLEGQEPPRDGPPPPPDEPPSDELRGELQELLAKQMSSWVDTPIPALGGKTPRQACATSEGRRKVERMVRTLPAASSPYGPIEPPRDELLRELGLL